MLLLLQIQMVFEIIKGVHSTSRPAPHIESLCHMSHVSDFLAYILPNVSHDTYD